MERGEQTGLEDSLDNNVKPKTSDTELAGVLVQLSLCI